MKIYHYITCLTSAYLSKIIDKLYYQLEGCLKKSDLFYKYRSVFGANVSFNSWLIPLTDLLFSDIDSGMHTDMTLIHLQKTFDTLDYKTHFKKMTCLDFKTPVIENFECYLSNKLFFASVDDFFSETGSLNCSSRVCPAVTPVFQIYQWSSPIFLRKWILSLCIW